MSKFIWNASIPVSLIVCLIVSTGVASAGDKVTEGKVTDEAAGNLMTLEEARVYWLELINRDRKSHKAKPVQLDETATKAGQYHADEMAEKHFNAHWHPDGSKPPERYTECGGLDFVAENSHGYHPHPGFFAGPPTREQLFSRKEVEEEEAVYVKSPGHLKNIIEPGHTHVGLGLKKIDYWYGADGEHMPKLVSAQEFIDDYGDYTLSARKLDEAQKFVMDGELKSSVKFYSVELRREDMPRPVSLVELNDKSKYNSYIAPGGDIVATFFPPPFEQVPEGTVKTDGHKFHCEFTPPASWKAGLYYVTVWCKAEGDNSPMPVAMSTLRLSK